MIAVIITLAKPSTGLEIINKIPLERRKKILSNIINLKEVFPDIGDMENTILHLQGIVHDLQEKTESYKKSEKIDFHSDDTLINILDLASLKERQKMITILKENEPEQFKRLEPYLIEFNDILKFIDRHIQLILRNADSRKLAVALVNNKKVQKRVFMNMNKRSMNYVKEEIAYMTPVTEKDIKEAEIYMVGLMRDLMKKKVIVLSGQGENTLIQ
ncbi:MAG: hypothetical protein JXB88_02965 [Spirochaetales bacterium]|nr:hypothetical protein [Spirochaetales bacterium]